MRKLPPCLRDGASLLSVSLGVLFLSKEATGLFAVVPVGGKCNEAEDVLVGVLGKAEDSLGGVPGMPVGDSGSGMAEDVDGGNGIPAVGRVPAGALPVAGNIALVGLVRSSLAKGSESKTKTKKQLYFFTTSLNHSQGQYA